MDCRKHRSILALQIPLHLYRSRRTGSIDLRPTHTHRRLNNLQILILQRSNQENNNKTQRSKTWNLQGPRQTPHLQTLIPLQGPRQRV